MRFHQIVREDSKDKNLLYAGTEQGFIFPEMRKTWKLFKLNLPVTPITDLKSLPMKI